ncbi:unnamed protein product [Rotaria sp. Silwood1]|nr:unnamed protein product [Rotaria sp. Silwood1]
MILVHVDVIANRVLMKVLAVAQHVHYHFIHHFLYNNAHSTYSPNCSGGQRAFPINDHKSNEAERNSYETDERLSEFYNDHVRDNQI